MRSPRDNPIRNISKLALQITSYLLRSALYGEISILEVGNTVPALKPLLWAISHFLTTETVLLTHLIIPRFIRSMRRPCRGADHDADR